MTNDSSKDVDLELYKRKPRERFSQARIIAALRKAAKMRSGVSIGIDKRAARILRCSPSTVRRYCRVYESVAAVKHEIEEQWRAQVDGMIAEIKTRLRGRKASLDREGPMTTLNEISATWRESLSKIGVTK